MISVRSLDNQMGLFNVAVPDPYNELSDSLVFVGLVYVLVITI